MDRVIIDEFDISERKPHPLERELDDLESQLTAAQKRLEIAEAALEHYADARTWARSDPDFEVDGIHRRYWGSGLQHGYSVAQTALREMEGKL